MGYLEIATNRGAANRAVGAEKGSEVGVLFEDVHAAASTG